MLDECDYPPRVVLERYKPGLRAIKPSTGCFNDASRILDSQADE
jgi:hypothetical protein